MAAQESRGHPAVPWLLFGPWRATAPKRSATLRFARWPAIPGSSHATWLLERRFRADYRRPVRASAPPSTKPPQRGRPGHGGLDSGRRRSRLGPRGDRDGACGGLASSAETSTIPEAKPEPIRATGARSRGPFNSEDFEQLFGVPKGQVTAVMSLSAARRRPQHPPAAAA
jgi:hypothetical protein